MGDSPGAAGVTVRPAEERDFDAISRFDLTYSARRYLAIERSGRKDEPMIGFRWREQEARDAVYASYNVERLLRARGRVELMLTAERGGAPVGLLMAMKPEWTDAVEITDLAVDRRARRRGAGRALVGAAAAWAGERSLRALWVEPRTDNAEAIDFYLRLGFRMSGFNDRMYSNEDDEPGRGMVYLYLELA